MAGQLLLINPRKRRASKKARKHTAKRRRNPIALRAAPKRRVHRRRNPIAHLSRRRRRNPISARGIMGSLVPMLKDAVIGAGGAIGVEMLWGKLAPSLPTSVSSGYAGAAVKAVATVALGHVLDKPTKGLGRKAAAGALAVQAYQLIAPMVGTATTTTATTAGRVGYFNPAPVTTARNALRFNPTGRAALPQPVNAQSVAGFTPVRSGMLSRRQIDAMRG